MEIETVLRSLEEVSKCVALCYHVGKADQAVLAFVVLQIEIDGPPSQQGNKIEKILSTKLREFEIPHVLVVESIPLLPNGKIDRQTLLAMYESGNKKGTNKQPKVLLFLCKFGHCCSTKKSVPQQ